MREGVTYKRLGEICDTTSGGTPSKNVKEYYENGNIPWLRSGELSQGYIYSTELFITQKGLDNSSAKIVPVNTVSIAMYGATVGEVGIIKTPMCTNQAICNILPNSSFIPEYLRYFLVSKKPEFINIAAGGAQPNISQAIIRNTLLPLLPLSTQELIVRELDSISSVISAKKQQVLELDNLAQAIFLDTFGDPITNPKGWGVKKMSEVAEIGSGGTPSKQNLLYWENGDVPWIGSNMCQNCVIYQTDGKYITRDGLNNSSAKLLSKGTVLVALVGATIGKVALLETETSTNQNVAFIKPKDVCLPYYLYFHLMHLYDLFMNIGNGDFKMANLSFVRNLPVSLPPLSLQQAFAEKVQAIEEQKRLINQSIAEFESLLAQRMEFHFA